MFIPTRPAPATPSRVNSLPPHHPFATTYTPPHHGNTSVSSVGSTISDTLLPIRTSSRYNCSSPTSLYSTTSTAYSPEGVYDYRKDLMSRQTTKSSMPSLAAPLSPSRPSGYSTPPPSARMNNTTITRSNQNQNQIPHQTYTTRMTQHHPISSIPTELSILDSRQRVNLLGDLEYIAGKKFKFPFIMRWSTGNAPKSFEERETRKLRKERRSSLEEEFGLEVEGLIKKEKKGGGRRGRNGRGVREGNWI